MDINLSDLFGKSNNDSEEVKPTEALPLVMVPVTDLIKLQKGYIEHLESKANSTLPVPKDIEGLAHKLKKMSRDSAMRLADTIRDALAKQDYEDLAKLERDIRKQAFGPPDSDGI